MYITKVNLNYTKTEITAYDIAEMMHSTISFFFNTGKKNTNFPIFFNTVKSGRFRKKKD